MTRNTEQPQEARPTGQMNPVGFLGPVAGPKKPTVWNAGFPKEGHRGRRRRGGRAR